MQTKIWPNESNWPWKSKQDILFKSKAKMNQIYYKILKWVFKNQRHYIQGIMNVNEALQNECDLLSKNQSDTFLTKTRQNEPNL